PGALRRATGGPVRTVIAASYKGGPAPEVEPAAARDSAGSWIGHGLPTERRAPTPRSTERGEQVPVEAVPAGDLPGQDDADRHREQDGVRGRGAGQQERHVHQRPEERRHTRERPEQEADADGELAERDQRRE